VDTAETQRVIDQYFDLMGRDEDFSVCYSPEVTWTMVEAGRTVSGPQAVRAYIRRLHAGMDDSEWGRLAVGSGWAYLEGDTAAGPSAPSARLIYCVAYDLADGRIVAMRCYGQLRDVAAAAV
jgi:hypothetical protein